jgi:mRNA-degrading endonuclease RelE of RelBE toxin-antitoxin system
LPENYKIRMADESKGKGKSGGFRVMYYLLDERSAGIEVLMLTIFDKSETSTMKKKATVRLKDYVLEKMGLPSKNRK